VWFLELIFPSMQNNQAIIIHSEGVSLRMGWRGGQSNLFLIRYVTVMYTEALYFAVSKDWGDILSELIKFSGTKENFTRWVSFCFYCFIEILVNTQLDMYNLIYYDKRKIKHRYRLFFLRSIAQFSTQIYMNYFVSS
jgi:hypothetical protein